MSYVSDKAAGKRTNTAVLDFSPNSTKNSNQEQFTGPGKRTVPLSGPANHGNQVRVQANDKGTGVLRNPLGPKKAYPLPAVQNPYGKHKI